MTQRRSVPAASAVALLALVLAWALAVPGTAQAAVCTDYSNQAAAQAAADTRDADGDGIYCESLPCHVFQRRRLERRQRQLGW
ncbi:MAG: hypothetical protein JWO02_2360 [Solirubrobacterales bacterium]|nr:hypothetical protein [Solirubrobacterales bacterium]